MIRFVHLMKKRPELTTAEFREYWNSPEFNEFLERVKNILGPVSVIKNATLEIAQNTALMEERGADEPYDGILEVWIESAADLKSMDSDEARAIMAESTAYQEKFIDFSESKRFFTEWNPTPGIGY